MISIENREIFKNAEKKAREVKPVVSTIELGTYVVWGHETNYTVKFGKDCGGHWQAECTCKAHISSANPKPCYHLVSAYNAFKIQIGIRKQVREFEASQIPSVSDWIITPEAA